MNSETALDLLGLSIEDLEDLKRAPEAFLRRFPSKDERLLLARLLTARGASIKRACELVRISRTTYYRRSPDVDLIRRDQRICSLRVGGGSIIRDIAEAVGVPRSTVHRALQKRGLSKPPRRRE